MSSNIPCTLLAELVTSTFQLVLLPTSNFRTNGSWLLTMQSMCGTAQNAVLKSTCCYALLLQPVTPCRVCTAQQWTEIVFETTELPNIRIVKAASLDPEATISQ